MIRFVRFLLSALALDARGHRAVAATMADWEHELQRAPSFHRRLLVNVRSALGVARTLLGVGVDESAAAAGSSFFWRLAALAGLWVAWRLSAGVPVATERFFLVTSDIKAWTLVAASLLQQGLIVFPLMVFLAEAIGRRRRVTPVAGTLIVLAAIGVVVGLVVLPASATYLRYETWRYFANASVPAPAVSNLLLSFLSVFATLSAIVGTWLLFVFANRIRRVGGATGWGMGVAVMSVGYLGGALMPFVPHVELRVALMLSSPLLTVGAILWATTRLAKIEDARSAAL